MLLVLVLLSEEEIAVSMAGEVLDIENQVLMVRIRVVVINATSTIYQLYHGGFIDGGNRSIRGKTTNLPQVTDKLYLH
jgi:hypothetical protein